MESGNKKLFQRGDVSLSVILGLVLISLALPASFRLVQQNQDVRKAASTQYVNTLSNKRTRDTDDCVALEYISPYCQDECGGDKSYKMWSWHNPGEDPKGWFGLPCGDACKGFGVPLFDYEQRNQCQEPIIGNQCATKGEMQAVGLNECVPYPDSGSGDKITPDEEDWKCVPQQWQLGACGGGECDETEKLRVRSFMWEDPQGNTHGTCGAEIEESCVFSEDCLPKDGDNQPTVSPTSTPDPTDDNNTWSGPDCNYDINNLWCGWGEKSIEGAITEHYDTRMGCRGVSVAWWKGTYQPRSDPDYVNYIENRSDFQRWVGDYGMNWIDTNGWRHVECAGGTEVTADGRKCEIGERVSKNINRKIVECYPDPLCEKPRLAVSHSLSVEKSGSPFAVVYSSPSVVKDNLGGVTLTLLNPNSGNSWTITSVSGQYYNHFPATDDKIYSPMRYDKHLAGMGGDQNTEDGEWYTIIAEKEGYLPFFGRVYIYDSTISGLSASDQSTQPTPTPAKEKNLVEKSVPGDANNDGNVDVSDFSIWRKEKHDQGADETQGDWQADFTGDGLVRNDDFSIWLNNLE